MDRREEILKAAYDLLGERGIEDLHARSVAAKVGVNHALIHYYFAKREDLLLAIANYLKQRFDADVEHFQQKAKTPGAKVAASLSQCEAYCKPASRLYRVWANLFIASQKQPELKDVLLAFWKEWAELFDRQMAEAVKAKQASKNSAFASGSMLLASMLGVGLVAHMTGDTDTAIEHLDAIDASLQLDT